MIVFWKNVYNEIGEHLGDTFPFLIARLAVILTAIFLSVGWIANLVKIFYAPEWNEIFFRIMAALIFPIGAFYGYIRIGVLAT